MENVFKIIYDKTINNKMIGLKDIEKILEILVSEKELNGYIKNTNIEQIRGNNLASYSRYTKQVTIYTKCIEKMVNDINNNIMEVNDTEKILYINLRILQIILHEVEHANQQKIAYSINSFEALIIRLSYLIKNPYADNVYSYCPEERLAEIKSITEVKDMLRHSDNKFEEIHKIIEIEKLKRELAGYHYSNYNVNIPIVDYFITSDRIDLIQCINFEKNDIKHWRLNERFKYGLSITTDEYKESMKKLIVSMNRYFNNRIYINKN